MYLPTAFREEELSAIHEMVRAARLAQLVTSGAGGLFATPLPMILDASEGERGVLYGHVSKGNPHWKIDVAGDALAIFMGPDAYVSPRFYPSKERDGKVVPTWNYTTVHAYGPVEFFEDPQRILGIVTRLTDKHEGKRDRPWHVSDAPPEYLQSQLKGIVGLRMPISRLEGKRKLSQNRLEDDRAGARSGLAASSDPMDRDVAALIPK
jgi:transcriptional regulator